jgi:hypothetical protein
MSRVQTLPADRESACVDIPNSSRRRPEKIEKATYGSEGVLYIQAQTGTRSVKPGQVAMTKAKKRKRVHRVARRKPKRTGLVDPFFTAVPPMLVYRAGRKTWGHSSASR